VVRNDEADVEAILRKAPDHIVVSPGPCTPAEAGVSNEVIRRLGPLVPTLGVCLGHQCMAAAFGGVVARSREPVHGRTSLIHHDGSALFAGIADPFEATRYHSLVVPEETLPACFKKTAWTDDGVLMGLRHRDYPIWGVQFHPESILTMEGKRLLANFLAMRSGGCRGT
jgi:anthranilate synthase component 2